MRTTPTTSKTLCKAVTTLTVTSDPSQEACARLAPRRRRELPQGNCDEVRVQYTAIMRYYCLFFFFFLLLSSPLIFFLLHLSNCFIIVGVLGTTRCMTPHFSFWQGTETLSIKISQGTWFQTLNQTTQTLRPCLVGPFSSNFNLIF